MKRKVFVGFLVCITLLAGCGSNDVQDDLLVYVNESMSSLSDQEAEAIDLYDRVSGFHYTDDETLYYTLLDEVIPKYGAFIDGLENVKVETDELNEIHELYIEAANLQSSAFLTILTAIEEQDSEKINEANQKLADARKMLRDYQQQIDDLAEENDVVFE